MAFDYAAARVVAERLITNFGAAGSFVVPGVTGGFDPESGDVLADTAPATITGTVTPNLNYKSMEIDGTTIKAGDSYVFFHSTTAPPIGALITINSVTWRLVSIKDLTSAGGVNVYRKMQLRR